MAKFDGVECDQCGKIERTSVSDVPPDGWVTVDVRSDVPMVPGRSNKVVTCTKVCAIKWLKERDRIDKDLHNLTEDEFCKAHCSPGEDQEQSFHNPLCPRMKF